MHKSSAGTVYAIDVSLVMETPETEEEEEECQSDYRYFGEFW